MNQDPINETHNKTNCNSEDSKRVYNYTQYKKIKKPERKLKHSEEPKALTQFVLQEFDLEEMIWQLDNDKDLDHFITALADKILLTKGPIGCEMKHPRQALLELGGLSADHKKILMQDYQSDRAYEFIKENDHVHNQRIMVITTIFKYLAESLCESVAAAFPNYINNPDDI